MGRTGDRRRNDKSIFQPADRIDLLAMKFAEVRSVIGKEELHGYIEDLKKLPDQVEMLLNNKNRIQKFANRYLARKTCFLSAEGSIMRSLWRVH